ncbi:hypothetical protein AVEN_23666-1 [Araneus ventricosus]|uniref:Uncharacterized protein n=1 Tax=Araneus ventricosus TaxID=182803 RepID=A0A4Y2BK49_ARAVE|nr:hypothetical protein AVEN_23666-1 [Araneus ventricosus]
MSSNICRTLSDYGIANILEDSQYILDDCDSYRVHPTAHSAKLSLLITEYLKLSISTDSSSLSRSSRYKFAKVLAFSLKVLLSRVVSCLGDKNPKILFTFCFDWNRLSNSASILSYT